MIAEKVEECKATFRGDNKQQKHILLIIPLNYKTKPGTFQTCPHISSPTSPTYSSERNRMDITATNDEGNNDKFVDGATVGNQEESAPSQPTRRADPSSLSTGQDDGDDDGRHSLLPSARKRWEEYFLEPQASAEAQVSERNGNQADRRGTANDTSWYQRDDNTAGARNASDSMQAPRVSYYGYHGHTAAPWWGYHPEANSRKQYTQFNYYSQGPYGNHCPPPPLPPDSNYDPRLPFALQKSSSSIDLQNEDLLFGQKESRSGIPLPSPPPSSAGRTTETPTRSNRIGDSDPQRLQRSHPSQNHYYHPYQTHHHPPVAGIERQYSWEDWEYSQPPIPPRDYDFPSQSLQYLHHHHRETDLVDHVSRVDPSSSWFKRSPSPDTAAVPPFPVKKDDDKDKLERVFAPPLLDRRRLPSAPAKSTVKAKNALPPGALPNDTLIRGLRPFDVLCGRGIKAEKQEGNVYLRELVLEKQVVYLASIRSQKASIAIEIMDKIKEKGGRFLKKVKVRKYEQRGGDAWEEMGEKQIYDKVCQTLREGAPQIRQKMLEISNRSTAFSGRINTDKENSENHEV